MKIFTLFRLFLAAIPLLAIPTAAHSQLSIYESPFVLALINGASTGKIDNSPMMIFAANKIKNKTGSDGEVSVRAQRVIRFSEQPKCGRVTFALYQESSNTYWGQLGGQLNICVDGMPPLRVCKTDPKKLVLPSSICKDNSRPVDTTEVAVAIADAKKKGGLDVEQYRIKMMKTIPQPEDKKEIK